MGTKHFGWLTLTPGQIEVSRPFNDFVIDLDEKVYALVKVFSLGGSGVLDGLTVAASGNALIVNPGTAIVQDAPFLLSEPYTFMPALPTGYVVLRRDADRPKASVVVTSILDAKDVLLAQYDLSTQTVIDKRTMLPTPTALGFTNRSINATFGNGVSVIETGVKGILGLGFQGKITKWQVASIDDIPPTSGSIIIDVLHSTVSTYPNFTSMVGGGTKPSLANAVLNSGTTNDWAITRVTKDSIIAVQVISVTSLTRVWLRLDAQVEL